MPTNTRKLSPYERAGSAEINAMVERIAPAILGLLADGVPRTKPAIIAALAGRHDCQDVVHALIRLAVTGRVEEGGGRYALVRAQRRPCARRPRSHLVGMHPPIFVREPSAAERARLEAGLRAPSAFTVRRAQIVLASADGGRPRAIARDLRCAVQTVRNGIRAFNAGGLAALTAGSSRPRSAAPVLGAAELERLRAILHQPPRAFGHARSTWTLDLLAQAAHEQGLSPTVLSGETIRQALRRLGVGWKRAKRWLTSPDPAYAQKNAGATG